MEGLYIYMDICLRENFSSCMSFLLAMSRLISLGFLFLLQRIQREYNSIIAELYYTLSVEFLSVKQMAEVKLVSFYSFFQGS